jgi:hypothetical protein
MTSYLELERQIHVLLIDNCQHTERLIEWMNGTTDRRWTAFRLDFVFNSHHVRFAALKSMILQSQQKLKTKLSWHNEVLYQLSPSSSISESMSNFQLRANDTLIGFVIWESMDSTCDAIASELLKLTQGVLISHDGFDALAHQAQGDDESKRMKYEQIKKLFQIPDEELDVCGMESAIETRIATKDVFKN